MTLSEVENMLTITISCICTATRASLKQEKALVEPAIYSILFVYTRLHSWILFHKENGSAVCYISWLINREFPVEVRFDSPWPGMRRALTETVTRDSIL